MVRDAPRRTHMMARVVIWLALLLAGATAPTSLQAFPTGTKDSYGIVEQRGQPPAVLAQAVHALGAHGHEDHSPCGHGQCGQCCPSCSTPSLGCSLAVDYRSIIQLAVGGERYPLATPERPHAWLSQLLLRPPSQHA